MNPAGSNLGELDMRSVASRRHTEAALHVSNRQYIQELVSRWDMVEARIFFGFELSAALLILMSWYPFKIRSACCIPAYGGCRLELFGGISMSWATFRQFVPSIGLILVACCPTVKIRMEEFKPADSVLILTHGAAALMLFVGFLMSEAHALSVPIMFTQKVPFRCRAVGLAKSAMQEGSIEHKVRLASWYVAAGTFLMFLIVQVVLAFRTKPSRKWSATSFLLEVTAGLSILFNHAAIWYYSAERHGIPARSGAPEDLGDFENHIQYRRDVQRSASTQPLAETELATVGRLPTPQNEDGTEQS